MENSLAKLDRATQMLAEAKTLDEVKKIRDIAESARVYARAAKLGLQAYNHAAEVKVRAERKAGEMLKQLERKQGQRSELLSNMERSDYREVLDENEISNTSAHRWQLLADMPELVFEEQLEELRGESPITTNGILKEIRNTKISKERSNAENKVKKVPTSKFVSGLYLGDMKDEGNQIKDSSIDLILTDPPYPGEFLYCWDNLSELAERVLKPSGFLIAYSGQLHLPEVMERLSNHLQYYWTMSLQHEGNNQLIMPRNVFCGWKPILIYQKRPFKRLNEHFSDVIIGSGREKLLHDWQQGEAELDYVINTFTLPGQVILDPFCGSGTTLTASIKNKRYAIGIEIEEESYDISKRRLSDVI